MDVQQNFIDGRFLAGGIAVIAHPARYRRHNAKALTYRSGPLSFLERP